MKRQTLAGAFCAGFFSLGLIGSADAALLGRLPATLGGTDYQAYYDDVLDITWLADANLAASNTFGLAYNTDLGDHPNDSYGSYYTEIIYSDGRMNWGAALHWVDAMNADGGTGYLGFNDWRLPSITDVGNDGGTYTNIYQGVDSGYNIDTANGEMASLWYDTLGNTAKYDTSGSLTGCATDAPFCLTNTGPFSNLQSGDYWSGVEYALTIVPAWHFSTSFGYQSYGSKSNRLYGWAVRSGDVSAVPVPAAVWLFGSGLIGLLGVAKRKRV